MQRVLSCALPGSKIRIVGWRCASSLSRGWGGGGGTGGGGGGAGPLASKIMTQLTHVETHYTKAVPAGLL